ncbi:MAG: 16S rRNA (adenine(1518)-N(6)/adenine(1519)-N(6))-dimethyltransferase RsmA [Candidatus Delongbacteria bacterium]
MEKSYKSMAPKKSLGQNFLSDPWWIERIARALEIQEEDCVLEIGPGKGALTRALLPYTRDLLAVEIDQRMVELLQAELGAHPNLRVIHEDFLRFDLGAALGGRRVRVVGNLPYHITSSILMRVLEEIRRGQTDPAAAQITDFAIMIQKEVAQRILSGPGSREYGILSVYVGLLCDGRILLDVPPGAFFPKPKVDSAVIRLRPLATPRAEVLDWDFFRRVVRAAFNQRRKMLRRSLLNIPGVPNPEGLENADELLSRRPETLSVPEFADLAARLGALRAAPAGEARP